MFEKIKELTKDTAIYGISTIIGRFLNFLLVPFYTNVFSTGDFGIFSNIYAYTAFLSIVYIYGMDAAFLKYASLENASKKKVFSTGYLFVVFTTILFSFIFYLFEGQAAEGMLIPEKFSQLIYYVIAILLFDTLALIPFANLRLERKSIKFAVIKTFNILINLSLNLVLILKYDWGIEAVFVSNLAASIFSFVVLIPEIMKYLDIKIAPDSLKQMLRFGLPYLPASVAATVVQVIDRPILMLLTDENTVGIYQASYKLGIFMMLFVMMFQYAWQPFFLTNAREKNSKEIFSKVLTIFVLAASVIWVVLSLFISDLASIEIWNGRTLIGRQFLGGLYIVPIILLAYIFHGMYINFTAGIYIEEKTNYLPLITGLGAAANIIVNFLLIPIYGFLGAAIATLASYMVMAVSLFFVTRKFYRIEYEISKLGKIFFIIILIGAAYYIFNAYGMLNLAFKFALLCLFSLMMISFKVVRISEIKMIINKFQKN